MEATPGRRSRGKTSKQSDDYELPSSGSPVHGGKSNKSMWFSGKESKMTIAPRPTDDLGGFQVLPRPDSPPAPASAQSSIVGSARHSQISPGGISNHRHAVRGAANAALRWDKNKLREPRTVVWSRGVVENKMFVAFTAVLTVYALVGDDFRLLSTDKPADPWFNLITIICIAVFLLEILLSCIGKDDYIFGFFMALDVVSSVTLILDLSYVSEILLGDGEDLDKMRSGRTARVGAKAGRVVRVIRLVRILKLYKAFYDAAKKHQKKILGQTDEDEWADIETTNTVGPMQESRVGKKLSEMTTRRVIILVLTMLLVLPFLRTQSADNVPASAYYGADEILLAYREFRMKSTDGRDINVVEESRERYENATLRYLYYHNWFLGQESCPSHTDTSGSYGCASWYYSHVFWFGIASTNEGNLEDEIEYTRLRAKTVEKWHTYTQNQNDIYILGQMSQQVRNKLASTWDAPCNEESKGIFRRGISELLFEDEVGYVVPCPKDLRPIERAKFYPRLMSTSQFDEWHFAFYFDTRPFNRSEAMFGLIITAFICFVLCVASLYFSTDANQLVLRPVEHMIKRVETIRDNPLMAMKMADEEFKVEEKMRAKQRLEQKNKPIRQRIKENCSCGPRAPEEPMETVVLEKTIIKLGSLLALGFGEAGANIIGHNMEESDSAGVNVMIPGTRVDCIVGKAGIRDFSTATEVLQAKVMTFVNQIAEIVHGVVDEFHGAANKNNGDTFLLIWRTSGLDEDYSKKQADFAMMSFAKILGAIHRSPVLANYRGHPGLQQRLGTQYRVCLSFGLHSGWAIEGAVGSEFKIDASYLSPNVSIASGVEASTKIYGVPIIATEAVVELCSLPMSNKCRLIDRVIIRGSKTPMMLYTLDLDYECLEVESLRDPRMVFTSRTRFKARQWLEQEKNRKWKPEVKMYVEFDLDQDIGQMRRRYTIEFLQLFHMGYQNYSHGEWQVARRLLDNARTMLRGVEDGPCLALMHFMDRHGFKAPAWWQGVRELPSDNRA